MGRVLVLAAIVACAPASRPRQPTYEAHRYYLNFLPFGAGQLQNGEPDKGVALAIAEGATAATSLGIWLYLANRYPGGIVPSADTPRVNVLEKMEIGAGLGFFALYGFGVVDAIVHYEPVVHLDLVPAPGGATALLSWSR